MTVFDHFLEKVVVGAEMTAWVLTTVILGYVAAKYRHKYHAKKKRYRQLAFTRNCVFNLLGKASESLQDNLDLAAFLQFFTDYTCHSVLAQSAAFFRYDKANRTVQAAAVLGVFPTVLDAGSQTSGNLNSPARIQQYLRNNQFHLVDTPFGEAVSQQRTVVFDEDRVAERVKNTVSDCWGMIIAPVSVSRAVYGLLVIANKVDRTRFTQEDVLMATNLAEMAGIVISHILSFQEMEDKRSIDQQLKMAEIIQEHLLPQKLPADERFEFAVHYQPAYRLGGDYYDFIELDENRLGVLVADVSGKGIPAGLVMATTRSACSILSRGEHSPSAVLRKLNEHLLQLIPEEMFISMTYGILDRRTGAFVCARAGHEPVIFCKYGEEPSCAYSTTRGMVLGMMDDATFTPTLQDETYHIEPGTMLLLYTDGVSEARNKENEEFGRQRLCQTLQTVAKMTAQNAMDSLVNRLQRFSEGQPPYDDITMVMIKAKAHGM
ncbi:PP2C family protein-serine/threonine phosphatase [bacterium]|nr:PP2C family protein-serine/threonine phosphatase [bacterium]